MIDQDEDTSTADLLDRCREAQADADRASAELAEALRLHRLNRLAEHLQAEYGACPLSREDLVAFLADQVERVKAAGVPGGDLATAMIDAAFLELQQQLG